VINLLTKGFFSEVSVNSGQLTLRGLSDGLTMALVTVTLESPLYNDLIFVGAGNDKVYGGLGDDNLYEVKVMTNFMARNKMTSFSEKEGMTC
jgi:Ca2+-binding RTX toxin-like protein